MIFDGMKFTKANTLLSRLSKEGDTYADGTAVPSGYYVVVKPNTCDLVREEGNTKIYNTDNGVAIDDMTGHSLTYMFYGKWKKRKSEMGVWVKNLETREMEVAHEYYQMTVYLMQRGRVYRASVKRAITPRQIEIANTI